MSFIKDLLKWGAVRGSRDPVTGGIGLSSGGTDILIGSGARTVIFGDSFAQAHQNFWYGSSQVTAMSRAAGVVTVSISAHAMPTGRSIRVVNAVPATFDGEYLITRTGTGTFTYPCPGVDESANTSSVSVIDREWLGYSTMLYANGLLGGRLKVVKNLGVGGNTSADMLARIQDVFDAAPDVVVVLAGYNDIGALTASQTISNYTSIAGQISSRGIKCVLCTLFPLNASGAKWTAANVEHILAVNRAIRALGLVYGNVFIADAFRLAVDKHNTTNRGAALTGSHNTDNVHPSPRGHYYIGKAIYSAIKNVVPEISWATSSCAAETAVAGVNNFNAIDHAPSTTSGGSVSAPATGTAATGITVERNSGSTGACAASVVTHADGTYMQRMAITPGGIEVWSARSNSGGTLLTRLTAGERRRFALRLKLSGITGVSSSLIWVIAWFSYAVDGVQYYAYIGSGVPSLMSATEDCELALIGEPHIVPAGTISNCGWYVQCGFNGAMGSAVNIDVGDVTLLQTTDDPA